MANVLGAITTSHVPAIGGAIAKGLQQDPYFKPFFDGFPPVHAWLDTCAPGRRRRVLQRPRPQFLPRQVADVRRRRGARVPQCRRGLGHPDAAAVQGRSRALVAPDRFAGGRRVRHHDVPGDAGRPRADAADGAAVAGRRRVAGAHRADRDEPRPASAAVAAPQLPSRAGGGPRARRVGRGRARPRAGHRRTLAPARRRARRLHQQAVRPDVHGRDRRRPRAADAPVDARARARSRRAGHRAHDLARGARRADGRRHARCTRRTTSRSRTPRRR